MSDAGSRPLPHSGTGWEHRFARIVADDRWRREDPRLQALPGRPNPYAHQGATAVNNTNPPGAKVNISGHGISPQPSVNSPHRARTPYSIPLPDPEVFTTVHRRAPDKNGNLTPLPAATPPLPSPDYLQRTPTSSSMPPPYAFSSKKLDSDSSPVGPRTNGRNDTINSSSQMKVIPTSNKRRGLKVRFADDSMADDSPGSSAREIPAMKAKDAKADPHVPESDDAEEDTGYIYHFMGGEDDTDYAYEADSETYAGKSSLDICTKESVEDELSIPKSDTKEVVDTSPVIENAATMSMVNGIAQPDREKKSDEKGNKTLPIKEIRLPRLIRQAWIDNDGLISDYTLDANAEAMASDATSSSDETYILCSNGKRTRVSSKQIEQVKPQRVDLEDGLRKDEPVANGVRRGDGVQTRLSSTTDRAAEPGNGAGIVEGEEGVARDSATDVHDFKELEPTAGIDDEHECPPLSPDNSPRRSDVAEVDSTNNNEGTGSLDPVTRTNVEEAQPNAKDDFDVVRMPGIPSSSEPCVYREGSETDPDNESVDTVIPYLMSDNGTDEEADLIQTPKVEVDPESSTHDSPCPATEGHVSVEEKEDQEEKKDQIYEGGIDDWYRDVAIVTAEVEAAVLEHKQIEVEVKALRARTDEVVAEQKVLIVGMKNDQSGRYLEKRGEEDEEEEDNLTSTITQSSPQMQDSPASSPSQNSPHTPSDYLCRDVDNSDLDSNSENENDRSYYLAELAELETQNALLDAQFEEARAETIGVPSVDDEESKLCSQKENGITDLKSRIALLDAEIEERMAKRVQRAIYLRERYGDIDNDSDKGINDRDDKTLDIEHLSVEDGKGFDDSPLFPIQDLDHTQKSNRKRAGAAPVPSTAPSLIFVGDDDGIEFYYYTDSEVEEEQDRRQKRQRMHEQQLKQEKRRQREQNPKPGDARRPSWRTPPLWTIASLQEVDRWCDDIAAYWKDVVEKERGMKRKEGNLEPTPLLSPSQSTELMPAAALSNTDSSVERNNDEDLQGMEQKAKDLNSTPSLFPLLSTSMTPATFPSSSDPSVSCDPDLTPQACDRRLEESERYSAKLDARISRGHEEQARLLTLSATPPSSSKRLLDQPSRGGGKEVVQESQCPLPSGSSSNSPTPQPTPRSSPLNNLIQRGWAMYLAVRRHDFVDEAYIPSHLNPLQQLVSRGLGSYMDARFHGDEDANNWKD